jgi:predicted cobalt transporter CbtA
MAAADLYSRQVWWIGTALATASGLALLFVVRRLAWAPLGALLIATPHLIGAPQAFGIGVGLPNKLIIEFGIATLVTNLFFWASLGVAAGILFEKLRPAPEPDLP